LFRTADTVLAVSPTRSATDLRVTAGFLARSVFFLRGFIRQIPSLGLWGIYGAHDA
jgi:hypothetical protein